MPTIPDTSVKWISNEMRGAPTLSGAVGTLIDVLDAFLLTGWGLTEAISVTVADGIATATLTPGETFLKHAVVLVAGATPGALNGEARVLSSTNTSITWATAASDGPATGTITIKYAPQGQWEKAFSATNIAVYRSTDVTGSRWCYRINDTTTGYARVAGWESMDSDASGLGRFPPVGTLADGLILLKSDSTGSGSKPFFLAADSKFIIFTAVPVAGASLALRGFGEPLPTNPAGDPFAAFVSGSHNTVLNAQNGNSLDSNNIWNGGTPFGYGRVFFARDYSGLGSSVEGATKAYVGNETGNAWVSGGTNGAMLGAFPSVVDGRLKLSRRYVYQTTENAPRAEIPGVFSCPQSGLNNVFSTGDTVLSSDGRALYAIGLSGTGISPSKTGVCFVDITGPWR